MGIEIAGYQYKREGYFLIDREFELSEIRLLCDAVAASDMIKESSSKIIIKKLLESQSIFQSRKLQECAFGLWQEIAETFGKNAAILKKDKENITVKINTIPSVIYSWVIPNCIHRIFNFRFRYTRNSRRCSRVFTTRKSKFPTEKIYIH